MIILEEQFDGGFVAVVDGKRCPLVEGQPVPYDLKLATHRGNRVAAWDAGQAQGLLAAMGLVLPHGQFVAAKEVFHYYDVPTKVEVWQHEWADLPPAPGLMHEYWAMEQWLLANDHPARFALGNAKLPTAEKVRHVAERLAGCTLHDTRTLNCPEAVYGYGHATVNRNGTVDVTDDNLKEATPPRLFAFRRDLELACQIASDSMAALTLDTPLGQLTFQTVQTVAGVQNSLRTNRHAVTIQLMDGTALYIGGANMQGTALCDGKGRKLYKALLTRRLIERIIVQQARAETYMALTSRRVAGWENF